MGKKILHIFMSLIIVFSAISLAGCAQKASDYSEEEHIQRVTARIEKRFMTEEAMYTSFSVYPLYNENDELNYFLVEFEPYGFIYVLLRDEQLKFLSCLGASTSMYTLSIADNKTWSPYIFDITNSQAPPDIDKIWILDENGEKIVYDISPYKVVGINYEKRYLLYTNAKSLNRAYIPAIKREEGFINLISGEEFEIADGNTTKPQSYGYIMFNGNNQFDL